MVDDSINNLNDFIKGRLENGYTWGEVSKLTLSDLQLMTDVYKERTTTIDKLSHSYSDRKEVK